MSDASTEYPDALPCPRCLYDLRGQTQPRCPECGTDFGTRAEMLRAVAYGQNLGGWVAAERQKAAWWVVGSMSVMSVTFTTLDWAGIGDRSRLAGDVLFAALLMLLLASGVPAFRLIVRIIRLRFDRRYAIEVRRGVTASIPFLLFIMIPCWIAVLIIAVMLT